MKYKVEEMMAKPMLDTGCWMLDAGCWMLAGKQECNFMLRQ